MFATDVAGRVLASRSLSLGEWSARTDAPVTPDVRRAFDLSFQLSHERGHQVFGIHPRTEDHIESGLNAIRTYLGLPVRDPYPSTLFRRGDAIYQYSR